MNASTTTAHAGLSGSLRVSGSDGLSSVMTNRGVDGVPAYSFIGDEDTGMLSPGANNIALSTAGTRRYLIDGSGNHSIYGNTSFSSPMSCNYGAIFNEGGNDSDTRIEGSGDANLVTVDAGNDRVGIGTSSPAYKLDVEGDISFSGTLREGSTALLSGDGSYVTLLRPNGVPGIYLGNTDTNNYYDNTGHIFRTAGGVANLGKWNSTGLGIGTTSPSATLEVNGTSNFTDTMYIDHGGSDYSPAISFMGGTNTPGSNTYENAIIGYYDNSGTGNMLFKGNRGTMNWHFNDSDETLFLMASSGDFHAHQDVVAYSTSAASDKKFKENIKTIPYGLNEVLKMNPVEFDWKEKRNKAHDIGVIAQEIEKIIPEVVKESKELNSDETFKSVDYGKMVAVLIKAVQEQQKQIEDLKKEIKELKK